MSPQPPTIRRPIARCVPGLLALLVTLGAPGPRAGELPVDELLRLHHTEEQQVRLVLLPAWVTDRHGRAVPGLPAEAFRVYEDWVPQEIRYFSAELAEPISIAFLLDLSGSMRQLDKLEEAKEAIRYFVEALRPSDPLGLIGFADSQVTWITEFGTDRERFLARLEVQEAYGQTALYDAVAATPGLVDRRTRGRKAIVLITDGIDNASSMNSFSARRLAREVNVPIYTVGFSSLRRKQLARGSRRTIMRVLELFSTETGGALFVVHDPDDLKEAVASIDEELRSSYLIGYYPSRTLWDGSYRRIKLEVTRKGLSARTRQGYLAVP